MSLSRFEDRLLRSGRADGPKAAQTAAARAALMGAAFGATVATATTASAAKGAAAATAKGLGMLKLLAVVVIGVGAAVSYRVVTPAPEPIAMTAPSPQVFTRSIPKSPVAIPAVSVDSLPTAPPEIAVAAAAPDPGDVAEETRLLASARDCNANGDYGCSASRLGEYQKRFPKGQLVDEAELVSIDRLRRTGNIEEARRRLATFLERKPNHPFARDLGKRLSEVP